MKLRPMTEAPTAGDDQILILAECADGSRAWVACAPTGEGLDYGISMTADRLALGLEATNPADEYAWDWLDSDGYPMLSVTVLGWIPAPEVTP
jgi:hypothetical protein